MLLNFSSCTEMPMPHLVLVYLNLISLHFALCVSGNENGIQLLYDRNWDVPSHTNRADLAGQDSAINYSNNFEFFFAVTSKYLCIRFGGERKKRNPQQINGHEKSGKRRTKQTNKQIIWFIGEWAGAWLQSHWCHINSWYADMRHMHSIICGREFGVQPHRSVYVIDFHFSFVFHRFLWSKTFFGFVSFSWVVFEMATF